MRKNRMVAMKTVAIVNGTVYRAGDAAPGKANVVIRGGKIKSVGPKAEPPRGAEVIDAGADSLAVISALLEADDFEAAARAMMERWQ